MLKLHCLFLLPAVLLAANAGKDYGVERTTYTDPVTGLRIHEMAAPASAADNLYFHVSNFTADNRYLLFVSDRTGSWQLFRSEVETGRVVQLTDDPRISARSALPDPRDPRTVYILRGPDVLALDIQDFRTRLIGTIPPPHQGGFSQPSLSADGKSLAVTKQRDQRTWEIGLIDIATGAYRTVITQGFRIGHIQHSPTDPVIFYVWETGGFAPQRSWLVNDDGSGNRPFYTPIDPKQWITPLKEWLTHEAWVSGTGEMTMVNDKLGVMLLQKDGTARVVRRGDYWHAAGRGDGKFIAIDDAMGNIWISETRTGNIRLLATGIRDKVRVHGHLSFDRRGRYIQFHTGRTRETVALVEVGEEAEPRLPTGHGTVSAPTR